jgi:hypothetical protein
MMDRMKFCLTLLAAALGMQAAEIGAVKTVYLLPMSSSLDQFLAQRLTSGGVLQVVTDPKKADAILSDRIGAGLDATLEELYATKKPAEKGSDKNSDKSSVDDSGKPVVQPVSRARGTIFLIDRKTRDVLWSMYERPKSAQPDDMNRAAEKIATQLSKDLKGK